MGDKETLKMARQELEALYIGVPDESVDLTFKDMPSFQQGDAAERKAAAGARTPVQGLVMDAEAAGDGDARMGRSLTTSLSLDFSRGLQGVLRERSGGDGAEVEIHRERAARSSFKVRNGKSMRPLVVVGDGGGGGGRAYGGEVSMMSAGGGGGGGGGAFEGHGGGWRRRPGIPHSNICALCSNSVYLFRHRCLVCGRVYCRHCVRAGMGEMAEGRKCVECLGKRYSHRYIHKAGKTWCWIYPNAVKIQEMIWAEKGPARRRPPSAHGTSVSRSVMAPCSPSRSYVDSRVRAPTMPTTRSFVAPASSAFSPNPYGFPL